MRIKPTVDERRLVLALVEQYLEKVRNSLWLVTSARHVDDRFGICLQLVVAAVSGEEGVAADSHCHDSDSSVADVGERAERYQAEIGPLLLLDLLDRMPLHDVTDLVAHGSGELIEAV